VAEKQLGALNSLMSKTLFIYSQLLLSRYSCKQIKNIDMHISTHLQATLNPSRAQHMTTLMQTKGRIITQNSSSIELLLITPAAIAKA
jgi:hypothetical protein